MIGSIFGVLFDGFAYGDAAVPPFGRAVGDAGHRMNFVNLAHCSFAMLGGYVTVT